MLRTMNTECRPSLLSYPPLLNCCHTPPVNAGCRGRQAHAYRLARDPPRTAEETKTAQLPVLATPQQTAMEERERGTPEAGVLLGLPGLPPHYLGGKRRYPAWAADRPPWCLPRPVDWLRQRSGRCENENDTPKSPSKVGGTPSVPVSGSHQSNAFPTKRDTPSVCAIYRSVSTSFTCSVPDESLPSRTFSPVRRTCSKPLGVGVGWVAKGYIEVAQIA